MEKCDNEIRNIDNWIQKEEKKNKLNKKMLKEFYDKQVKVKKEKDNFEHEMNMAQGRIWKQDYLNYLQYENDTNRRIKELIRKNLQHAGNNQNVKKNYDEGMSENEKAMNKEMLEKAMEAN